MTSTGSGYGYGRGTGGRTRTFPHHCNEKSGTRYEVWVYPVSTYVRGDSRVSQTRSKYIYYKAERSPDRLVRGTCGPRTSYPGFTRHCNEKSLTGPVPRATPLPCTPSDLVGRVDRMTNMAGGNTTPRDPRDLPGRELLQCSAHSRTSGERCKNKALAGTTVCKFHGGAAPQVQRKAKMRLAELVAPAIATLAKEMAKADRSADRQRAANSILDRSGYGRTTKIEASDARDALIERLMEMADDPTD